VVQKSARPVAVQLYSRVCMQLLIKVCLH